MALALCSAGFRVPTAATTFLQRTKKAAAVLCIGTLCTVSSLSSPASAFGPTDVKSTITGYKRVELCSGKKPIMPGQKAALVR
jgi:hypothetical protein